VEIAKQIDKKNVNSLRALVVTDEDRTFFRITIPCHEAAGNIIADDRKRGQNNHHVIESPMASRPSRRMAACEANKEGRM